MSDLVKINNQEISIKEYRGQRVTTFKDIDLCHERIDGTASRNFREHRGRMIEGVDYFSIDLTTDEIRRQYGAGRNASQLTLITECGYLMLVKSLNDDLAWSVQREIVNNYFRPKTKKPRKKSVDVVFRQNVNMANLLVQSTGIKKGIALAVAIERTERSTGEDLSMFRNLLPSAEHDIGYLNPTQLGARIGESNRKVNQLLLSAGLQYKDDSGDWRLTDPGKDYGEELPYSRNGHSGYQIRWNEKVLNILSTAEHTA